MTTVLAITSLACLALATAYARLVAKFRFLAWQLERARELLGIRGEDPDT